MGSCILLDFKNVHLSINIIIIIKKTWVVVWVVVLCLFCFILVIIKYDKNGKYNKYFLLAVPFSLVW